MDCSRTLCCIAALSIENVGPDYLTYSLDPRACEIQAQRNMQNAGVSHSAVLNMCINDMRNVLLKYS